MMLTDLKNKVGALLAAAGWRDAALVGTLETPKRSDHGQLALPVFALAKLAKQAPPKFAAEMAKKLESMMEPADFSKIEAVHGFVNFHFQPLLLQRLLFHEVGARGDRIGESTYGQGKTMVIDFSSPNVAKPMHVGHLRATVIGQAIVNLAKSQGYRVIGLNHLGDWGVQFGNLAWAYQNWGHEYPFKEQPFQSLYQLYVRFHEAAEHDAELARAGAETFKKLEQGDPEITRIWRMVVEISLKEYSRLWKLLGVQHDLVRGESFYNDRMKPVEDELERRGLLVESDGAMVVRLDDENIVPCLIRKTDGASLYATRDLASAIYRREELGADLNLYVVGAEQTLHFRQVFSVLRRMGYDWVDTCHHISFGMYRFKDIGKMSSRKGNVILLEDVLGRAVEMVRQIIATKNPDLPDRDRVAEQVGVGAVIFNDLMNDRVRNVEFDWDRMLDFEGDSGPYVQYCLVRCNSLLKKYGKAPHLDRDFELSSREEQELIRHMLGFPEVVSAAFAHFKPHLVATFLIEVCRLFGQFYTNHRILGEAPAVEEGRMALVASTRAVLAKGLALLNIPAPDAM